MYGAIQAALSEPDAPDAGGHFAHHFLIDSGNGQLLAFHLGFEALGQFHQNGVGEADGKLDDVALDGNFVADADDFHRFGKALAHAFHTVGEKSTAQAVLSPAFAGVFPTGQGHVPVREFILEQTAHRSVQGPLGTFHFHHLVAQLHFHPFGQSDGHFTYSRHDFFYLG